jgi:hypothetical protein
VILVLLGAGAGAAVVLLNHGNPGSAQGQTTPTVSASGTGSGGTPGSTTTLPPADLQITAAINMQRTGPLPAGFKTFSQGAQAGENAGWSLAGPASWTMSAGATSYQTYLRDPSATGVNILIDLTPHTYPADMLREARFIERQSLVENRFPGYQQQGLSAIPIRGTSGSYWKFTWQDGNTEQEAIDLLFVLQTPSGSQSYALYMTGPYSTFGQFRPIFDEMVETFLPLT